ncbi:major facilitator superfamily transporter monocarboxylate [Niveomyces insectorum RCEF 264]|uniref:Major facilitator superfamily transporter monocarboxylate n=1 Tax=Niveomyces insectorum RCEF 264 TaxID=1081102 RepID=A0A167SN09_9HYPO|nr:major facilitator superfamily transporter monocarboxylate [Niveomyces insectorum RCEF 264]
MPPPSSSSHDLDIEKDGRFSTSSSSHRDDDAEKRTALVVRETKKDPADDARSGDPDEAEDVEEEEIEDVQPRPQTRADRNDDNDDNDDNDSNNNNNDNNDNNETEEPPPPDGILARVLSRVSTARQFDPGPPPDGGWKAWMMVACTHLAVMNTWGVISSFGSYETYYTELLHRPPSDVAWIGSFQIFLLFFIGTFTGRLTDAGFFRHLLALGTVLQVGGVFCTAQCTQYWQFFLAQGVLMGLGNGCIFCPSLATVSTYFSTHRSLALGVTAAGSATGGLVYPSLFRQLLPQIGFPWAMRVSGFIQLATLLVVNALLRPRLPPRRTGRIVEWSAFREPQYAFYSAGTFTCFLSLYVAFFYVASYSRDIIGLSYSDSLNLLLVINGVGSVGRLVPNYFADRVGVLNMFVLFGVYCGIGGLAWIAVRSTAAMYVWSVFYGLAAGAVQSLFPAGLTSLTKDLSKTGVRMGMVFTINSIATLIGPPIAGALIAAEGGSYLGAQLFTGMCLLAGSCFVACSRYALAKKTGEGWRAKV